MEEREEKGVDENASGFVLDESPSVVREMTFGEKLVGLTFNPSNDDKVAKAKRLCADLADLLEEELQSKESSRLEHLLYPSVVSKILDAQTNVVRLLTLKY